MSASIAQRHVGDVVSGGNIFDQLAQVARDPSIDAGKLSVIYELMKDYQEQQRKDEADRARVAFYAALPDMQKELPIVRRDADNSHTKSSYARLETIWKDCCSVWTKWGFAVAFDTKMTNGQISTSMRLSHRAGHVETFHSPDAAPDTTGTQGRVNKTSVQGNQSVVSYQKRGLLTSGLGIVTAGEDDDGAGGRAPDAVVQRAGDRMPPVVREQSVVSYPPSTGLQQTAHELEAAKRQRFIARLRTELDNAQSASAVAALANRDSVKAAKNNPSWPISDRRAIDELIVDAMDRFSQFPTPSEEEIAARLNQDDDNNSPPMPEDDGR